MRYKLAAAMLALVVGLATAVTVFAFDCEDQSLMLIFLIGMTVFGLVCQIKVKNGKL